MPGVAIHLDVQIASRDRSIPAESDFRRWAGAIRSQDADATACLRIVDEEEARALNHRYRKVDKATNVLSFPASPPEETGLRFLGDVVICAPVVADEATRAGKEARAHWAHLLVHGILHLQGYVHEEEDGAREMEALEVSILSQLGMENPY